MYFFGNWDTILGNRSWNDFHAQLRVPIVYFQKVSKLFRLRVCDQLVILTSGPVGQICKILSYDIIILTYTTIPGQHSVKLRFTAPCRLKSQDGLWKVFRPVFLPFSIQIVEPPPANWCSLAFSKNVHKVIGEADRRSTNDAIWSVRDIFPKKHVPGDSSRLSLHQFMRTRFYFKNVHQSDAPPLVVDAAWFLHFFSLKNVHQIVTPPPVMHFFNVHQAIGKEDRWSTNQSLMQFCLSDTFFS